MDSFLISLKRFKERDEDILQITSEQYKPDGDHTVLVAKIFENMERDGESLNKVDFHGFCGTNSRYDILSITVNFKDENDQNHCQTLELTGNSLIDESR